MAATSDEVARARDCTTGQYHQVVAISADMLNEQLEALYWRVQALQSLNSTNRYTGKITASLKPPKISIPIAGQNYTKINYHVRIANAVIDFMVDDNTTTEVKLKDWELVFTCDIALDDVKDPAENAKLRDGLCVAGDYSIQRLLIDFKTANLTRWVPGLSKMPYPAELTQKSKEDWDAAWEFWIKKWLEKWPGTEKTALGVSTEPPSMVATMLYHATAPDPKKVNPAAATFPPTKVTYQTDFWQKPGGVRSDDQGRNCLLYLEMCGEGASLPPTLLYQHTGNFVSEDRKVDGAMCISRELFIERYFIERLRQVVWGTQFCVKSVSVNASDTASKFLYDLFVGDQNTNYWNEKFRLARKPGTTGYYCSLSSQKNAEDGVKAIWSGAIDVNVTSDVSLTWAENTNKLILKGSNVIDLHTTGKTLLISSGKRIKIEIEWSVNFLFKASDQTSGQINIDVEFPAKLCTVKSSTKNEEGLMIGGYDMSAAESNITNTFTAQLEKCKPYFEDVKKALSESKFVLSGSGYFNFTNPIFTRNGDLLVNIKYQAIKADEDRYKLPNQLGVVSQSTVKLELTTQSIAIKASA